MAAEIENGMSRSQSAMIPQVQANGILVENDHPVAGRLRQARTPALFSETPAEHRFGAPALGGQTREILAEAGYSAAEIDALIDSGAAAEPHSAGEDAA